MFSLPRVSIELVALCAGACVIAAWALAVVLNWLKPVSQVQLGDHLEVRPWWRRVPPADVESVTFGPDPAEDYAELTASVPNCQATVRLRSSPAVRLIVSLSDAAQLAEWAVGKGVDVHDPHGYSTRRVRDAPT